MLAERLHGQGVTGSAKLVEVDYHIKLSTSLPKAIQPGSYLLGLWLPDRSESLRYNPDYAIRVANGNAPFRKSVDERYGINLIGTVEVY